MPHMAWRVMRLAAPLLAGCSEPDWTRVVGSVSIDADRTVYVAVPAQVEVGDRFEVTVSTIGSSYCIRADGNDLTVAGNLARIVPYDEVPPDGQICARDAIGVPHTVVLRFDEPGTAILRVVGMFELPEPRALDSVDIEIEVR